MFAGIDLGGTQVRVALARSDGQLIASFKTSTPLLGTPQRVVDWAAAEIERHRGRAKVRSITIAAPGPIDIKRGVLVNPPNLPGWRNVPLAAMLREATGATALVANDADMAGLGEFHRGAGQGTGEPSATWRGAGARRGATTVTTSAAARPRSTGRSSGREHRPSASTSSSSPAHTAA